MRHFSRFLVVCLLGTGPLLAQSLCGTGIPAADKNLTGLWAEPSGAINTYNLVQTGLAVTATANIPASRNETLSFGTITFDGTNLVLHFSYGFPAASPPYTGSETLFFKLSADGNTLTGTYVYTTSLGDNGSGSITWVRNTGTAILVPTTVQLAGAPGGSKVTDNTSLTLWNCGRGPANFTLSTMSTWLKATSASATLAAGSSTTLTLTADPSQLTTSGSPYRDVLTVGAANPRDFAGTTAAITFTLGGGKDNITVTSFSPRPNANLETGGSPNGFGESIAFSVKIGGTLNSASADVYLELFDDGVPIWASPRPTTIPQGVINQTLSDAVAIPDGVQEVQLVIQFEPKGGKSSEVPVASYLVLPHVKIGIGFGGSSVWGPPATSPVIGLVIGFAPGSPDRGTVLTLTPTNADGSSAGTIPPIDVSLGAGYYPAILTPSIGAGATSISVEVGFANATPGYLDPVSIRNSISVAKPPTITGFELAGQDGAFTDASQPVIFGVRNTANYDPQGTVLARLTYSGLDQPATAALNDGSGFGVSESIPAGNGSVTLGAHYLTWGGLLNRVYSAQITNGFGQTCPTCKTSASPGDYLESVEITSASATETTLNVSAQYVWPGSKGLYVDYSLHDVAEALGFHPPTDTCVSPTTTSSPQPVDCPAIPITASDPTLLSVDITVYDTGPGAIYKQTVPIAHTASVTQGTVVQAGPVSMTPSANGPPVTFTGLTSSLGKALATSDRPAQLLDVPGSFRPVASAGNSGTPVLAGSLVFVGTVLNFSPAVPNNSTQMVYAYTAANLPDDPGFNPANLELVSYDPSSGHFTTYPSFVDTNAMTVTSTLPGIPPYLGLAFPASTLSPELNLPFDPQQAPAPAGIALFNAGASPADITLVARGGDGTALATQPSSTEMIPAQQAVATFDSLGAAAVTNPGWVQASASVSGTVGVAMLADLFSLESVPLLAGSYTEVIPGIELATGQGTQISVANATPFQNPVALELRDTTGKLVDTAQLNLGPKQAVTVSLGTVFVNAQPPVQGYVILYGGDRLSATAVATVGNAMSALAGQSLSANGTTLFAPYFAAGPGQTSRLDIVNPGSAAAHVTIQFARDDGALLAASISATIAPGAQYWIDLAGALGLNTTKASASGSISVTSDQPGLIGDVTITDRLPVANYRTSIPLAPAQTSQAIPYVVNTTALPMTVYAANAGIAKANVTFTLYGTDSSVVGTATSTVAPGGRLVSGLTTLIAAASGQLGGALEIDSDQPLSVAGIIFPANPAGDWAAIPAQPSSLDKPNGPTPLIGTGGITMPRRRM